MSDSEHDAVSETPESVEAQAISEETAVPAEPSGKKSSKSSAKGTKKATAEEPEPVDAERTESADVDVEPVVEPVEEVVADDTEQLKAEIERLKAENAALVAEPPKQTFWRNASASVLILIGVLLVAMSISALWLNRTMMDEERFVGTFAPLAQNVAIQDWVAKSSTDAIFANVDIEGYVKQALEPLPPQAAMLAAPITGAVQNFITEAATKIVRSPQFPVVWEKTLRLTHKAFIAAVSDKSTGVITKQGGVVTLDVTLLVDEIKQALVDKGLGFVQNINLPISTSQVTLVDSQTLADFALAVQALNAMALVLPFLALALLSGGVAVAANRRKAVLWMGVGILTLTIIPVQALYLGQIPFTQAMLELANMPSAAATAAYDIIFVNLIRANQLASVIGLVFVIGAIFAGPSAWATALRNGLRHGLTNIGPDWDFGVVGEWIHKHESGMRTTGIIAAVIMLLLVPTKSMSTIIWLVVWVVLWMIAVTFFGRPRPVRPTADAVDAEDDSAVVTG